jgi:hypothetical protein
MEARGIRLGRSRVFISILDINPERREVVAGEACGKTKTAGRLKSLPAAWKIDFFQEKRGQSLVV